ncbi:glycosyltransferase [Arcticibacter sp.]|uniref:glycosyltransferase n=1 Tax=Arcticibacter sp. TaxID=1872630 RepID=UPI00388FA2C9
MIEKLLFVSRDFDEASGGSAVTKRNLSMCREIFGSGNVTVYSISKADSRYSILIQNMFGFIGGLSPQHIAEIVKLLSRNDMLITHVFIDTSLMGRLAEVIKKRRPEVKVVVFFHNVESLYFLSLRKTTNKIWHLLSEHASAHNEKNAVRYSDAIITLNSKDSNELNALYNRLADLQLPTSFKDQFREEKALNVGTNKVCKLLFVGSYFFANVQGILWFVEEVMPKLNNVVLKIVGKGFEAMSITTQHNTVEVEGYCPSLEDHYYEADLVISPIFVGGGMKTKVAEALMFGKTIIGTSVAFEGYELDGSGWGVMTDTVDGFVSFINNYDFSASKVNYRSREIYMSKYSFQRSVELFKSLKIGDSVDRL